jgi:nitrogen fixation/metabolism regulation signal transduction histidine kinase
MNELETRAAAETQPATADVDNWAPPVRTWARTRKLIDPRYQLPGSLLAVGVAVVLLVLLNVSVFYVASAGRRSLDRLAPQAEAQMAHTDVASTLILAAVSLLFLAGVYVLAILATHRSAGPVYRIRTALHRVEEGHYSCEVKLRKHDNFEALAEDFNRMLRGLQHHTVEDATALESLAAAARTLQPASRGETLAVEIEKLIRVKEQRLSR